MKENEMWNSLSNAPSYVEDIREVSDQISVVQVMRKLKSMGHVG